jgi:ABC-type sugar transport system ATPase subunit
VDVVHEITGTREDAERSFVVMRDIRKAFGGVQALAGVSLELRRGEIHAVAGENGSGKSTLVKILYGALQPDSGSVEVEGELVRFSSPRHALERGIVAISQELTLASSLTVAENVLLGRLPLRRGVVDWPEAQRRAGTVLEELGVHVDVRRRVSSLSIELQQEVEVARAVSANATVLVLDEATSSLSEAATERLLTLLEELRRRGAAVVFISHRLRELYGCATKVTVLRDGHLVGTSLLARTTERQLVRMMVGREIEDLFNKRSISVGDPALEVSNLSTLDGAVRSVNLTVRRGEIVGIAGLVGCGKTELGLALAGATAASGTVSIDGADVALHRPRQAAAAGIGFIPEDRRARALLPTRSVQHNLSIAWRKLVGKLGLMHPRDERRLSEETVPRFRIRTPSLSTRILQLSGGNQQKVVLGRCFTLSPRVTVLAEPTRGVDVGAKSEIYGFMQDLAEQGAALLIISSELPELLGVADRILVMYRGEIRGEFDARTATEEMHAHLALGAEEPQEGAA